MSLNLLSALSGAVTALLQSSALPNDDKTAHTHNIISALEGAVSAPVSDAVNVIEGEAKPVVEQIFDTVLKAVEAAGEGAIDAVTPAPLQPLIDPLAKSLLDKFEGSAENAISWLLDQKSLIHSENTQSPA